MKEVTLKIPDERWEFFLELINELGFDIASEIPEHHKKLVQERKALYEKAPGRLVSWEDIENEL